MRGAGRGQGASSERAGALPGVRGAVGTGAWVSLADGGRCAGRRSAVVLRVRVRRLVCPTRGCCQTFREQVPGVLERYQRRTTRLTGL